MSPINKYVKLARSIKRPITIAERLGIPKSERNMMTQEHQLALLDLMLYVNSGQYRQTFLVDPQKDLVKWGNKSDRFLPFALWFTDNNKKMEGNFMNQWVELPIGLDAQIRFHPKSNLASYLVLPTKVTDLLPYRSGEASMFGNTANSYSMRLTSPRVDALWDAAELLSSDIPEEVEQGKQLANLPNTLDKNTMRAFWQGVASTLRPGSYMSGDNGELPLGDQLINNYKQAKFTIPINLFGNNRELGFVRMGLSPDSYSSVLRLAQREGNDLRWGVGFTKWNDAAATNKSIFDTYTKYLRGELTAELYKQVFDDWALPLGGKPAEIRRVLERRTVVIDLNGLLSERVSPASEYVIIPHPYIYKRKNGGTIKRRINYETSKKILDT